MPWYGVGRRRYYRHERVEGRPGRRYIGTGPIGELAAAIDDLHRVERAIEAGERRAEQAPLLEWCAVTDVLTRAALLAAGYH